MHKISFYQTHLTEGQWGYLRHCIEKLVIKIRRKRKQSATPSVMALDAQSVKWGNSQSSNGFDANKKGKRHKTQYCC